MHLSTTCQQLVATHLQASPEVGYFPSLVAWLYTGKRTLVSAVAQPKPANVTQLAFAQHKP